MLDELSLRWGTLENTEKNEIATALGGLHQREKVLVLLENYNRALEIQNISLESAGSAQAKFNIYQDSAAAKLSELQNQFQILSTNTIEGGFVKAILEALTGLLKFISAMGGLIPIMLLSASAIKLYASASKLLTAQKLASTLANQGLAASEIAATLATKGFTSAQIEQALSANVATASELGLSGAIGTLTKSILANTVALFSNPIFLGVAALALVIGTAAWISYANSVEAATKRVEDATKAYDEAKSNLESVNTELKTATQRMDELNAKDKLTFAEEQELQKLKDITAELLIQEDILGKQEKKAGRELAVEQESLYQRQYGEQELDPEKANDAILKAQKTLNSRMLAEDKTNIINLLAVYSQFNDLKKEALTDYEEAKRLGSDTSAYEKNIEHFSGTLSKLEGYLYENVTNLQEFVAAIKEIPEEQRMEIFGADWEDQLQNAQNGIFLIYNMLDPAKWKEIKFSEILNLKDFEDAKKSLEEFGNSGKLTADILNDPKFKTFVETMNAAGISVEDIVTQLQKIPEEAVQVGDLFEETSKKVDLLNQALSEQSRNGKISTQTYAELIAQGKDYADLVSTSGQDLILLTDETIKYSDQLSEQAIQTAIANGATEEQISLLLKLLDITGTSRGNKAIEEYSKYIKDAQTTLKSVSDADYSSQYVMLSGMIDAANDALSKLYSLGYLPESSEVKEIIQDIADYSNQLNAIPTTAIDNLMNSYDALIQMEDALKNSRDLDIKSISSLIAKYPDLLQYIENENGVLKINSQAYLENSQAASKTALAMEELKLASQMDKKSSLISQLKEFTPSMLEDDVFKEKFNSISNELLQLNIDIETTTKLIEILGVVFATPFTYDGLTAFQKEFKDAQTSISTLKSANEEFIKNGYLSADTIANLSRMSSEYSSVLFDQTGKFVGWSDAASDLVRSLSFENISERIAEQQVLGREITATKESMIQLKEQFDSGIISTDEYANSMQSLGEKLSDLNGEYSENQTTIESWTAYINDATDKIKAFADVAVSMEDNIGNLSSAQKEYNETGYITAETFKTLYDNNLIQYLDVVNGKLVISTNSLASQEEQLKATAVANLQEAFATDIMNLAIGNTADLSPMAKAALEEAGIGAINAGNNAAAAAAGWNTYAQSVANASGIEASLSKEFQAISKGYETATKLAASIKIGGGGSGGGGKKEDPILKQYEEFYSNLKHLYKMDIINKEQYYAELDKFDKQYFANNAKYIKEHRAILEELWDMRRQMSKDYIADLEHEIGLVARTPGTELQRIEIYKQMQVALQKTADEYNQYGLDANHEYIEELENQWWQYFDAINNLRKEMLQNEIDALKEIKDRNDSTVSAVLDFIDEQIEKLNEQKDALKASNDEKERELKLAELEKKLSDARERTKRIYERGVGFVYVQDQEEIAKAQKELDDFMIKEQTRLIDEQIKGWDKYRKLWADIPGAFEKEQDKLIALQQLGADWEQKILNKRIDTVQNFATSYNKIMGSLYDLEQQKKQLEAVIGTETGASGISYDQPTGQSYQVETSTPKASQISKTLKKGDKGDDVATMQQALQALGFSVGPKGTDGIFGTETYNGLRSFQKAQGISQDGILGPETKEKFKIRGYRKGVQNLSKSQFANVDEAGEEMILRPTKGRFTYLDKGSTVLTNAQTKTLVDFAKSPISFMKDGIGKLFGNMPNFKEKSNSNSINIGDININTPIANSNDLAKEITNRFPNVMLQTQFS